MDHPPEEKTRSRDDAQRARVREAYEREHPAGALASRLAAPAQVSGDIYHAGGTDHDGGPWGIPGAEQAQSGRGGVLHRRTPPGQERVGIPFANRPPMVSSAREYSLSNGPPRAQRTTKNYTRSDVRIYEDVCEALASLDELDAREIEVQARSGEVTLSGSVPDLMMKFFAEHVSTTVSGVLEVHNQIRVKRG